MKKIGIMYFSHILVCSGPKSDHTILEQPLDVNIDIVSNDYENIQEKYIQNKKGSRRLAKLSAGSSEEKTI